jgi:uncharacterized SAM-binding protein YcdF (DUF218 family)
VAGVALLSYTPLANQMAARLLVPERLEPAQAIIVLGGGKSPDESPTDSSLRRLVYAIRLHKRGLAPLIVLTGGDPEKTGGPAESESMAQIARDLGVSPAVLILEGRSNRTAENGAEAARILGPRGIRRVLLVTSPLHMRRSVGVFRRVGFEVLPAPTDGAPHLTRKPWPRFWLAYGVAREGAGILYYWWNGWL